MAPLMMVYLVPTGRVRQMTETATTDTGIEGSGSGEHEVMRQIGRTTARRCTRTTADN